jgi:hypothetical protein
MSLVLGESMQPFRKSPRCVLDYFFFFTSRLISFAITPSVSTTRDGECKKGNGGSPPVEETHMYVSGAVALGFNLLAPPPMAA